jgi:hypothetical protein
MGIGACHHRLARLHRLAQAVQHRALEFPALGSKLPKNGYFTKRGFCLRSGTIMTAWE